MLRMLTFAVTLAFRHVGEEMEQNLPLEMDFRHEAANASRCASDFASLTQTTLVVPEVLWAKKRAMVMECELPSIPRSSHKKQRKTPVAELCYFTPVCSHSRIKDRRFRIPQEAQH